MVKDRIRDKIDIDKVARIAVIVNALEIAFVLAILGVALFGGRLGLNGAYLYAVICISAGFVIWGAVLDIREALQMRRVTSRMDALSDAIEQLEALNVRLRGQRHDFMNHLQVVYSLMELEEYGDAMRYIERTWDDIQSVSGFMKTASPAINALLMAKANDARQSGVEMELHLNTAWSGLPIEDWEMCRVLGNILDNAIDASTGAKDARITVELSEDIHSCGFVISNNGAPVPEELHERIFETNFTTKAKGTGMGLAIVRSIMREHGGDVTLSQEDGWTRFSGTLPKLPEPEVEERAAV